MDFLTTQLKKNNAASYASLREKAEARGLTIYPIMYGRAKALLGLVPMAPRGQGKYARQKREAQAASRAGTSQGGTSQGGTGRRAAPTRRPSRATPTSMRASAGGGSFENIVAAVQAQQEESARLRETLEKVRAVIDSAL